MQRAQKDLHGLVLKLHFIIKELESVTQDDNLRSFLEDELELSSDTPISFWYNKLEQYRSEYQSKIEFAEEGRRFGVKCNCGKSFNLFINTDRFSQGDFYFECPSCEAEGYFEFDIDKGNGQLNVNLCWI